MPTTMDAKRLYKSRSDRMIDGVCGGIAEYFALDPTLVRISWVLLTLLGGSGIILYIIAMIVMPANPTPTTNSAKITSGSNERFWGILLVVVGLFWLLASHGVPVWHRWWGFSWNLLLPLVLILAGVAFLFGGRNYVSSPQTLTEPKSPASEASTPTPENPPRSAARLYRSRLDRKLFGVCGGLGSYFNIDPTIIRILFAIAILASCGIALVFYVLMAIVVPEEPIITSVS